MLVVDRTHLLVNDLDWAPSVLTKRSLFTRSRFYYVDPNASPEEPPWLLWPLLLVPIVGDLIFFFSGFGGGSKKAVETDPSATYDDPLLELRLPRLAATSVPIAELAGLKDGSLVRLEGKVIAKQTIPGLVVPERGVARRLAFRAEGHWWIHEALVDFELESDGHRVPIQVANARIADVLGPPTERVARDFLGPESPLRVRQVLDGVPDDTVVRSAERTIADGQRVAVIGHKQSIVDAHADRGYRDVGTQAIIAGGLDLPLIIHALLCNQRHG